MRYMASFYWAILMTTGLNVPIGPGLRQGQIVYECLICFLGVCMQARLLCLSRHRLTIRPVAPIRPLTSFHFIPLHHD